MGYIYITIQNRIFLFKKKKFTTFFIIGCEPVYTILIQLPNPKREKDPDSASIRILSETSLNDLSKSDR